MINTILVQSERCSQEQHHWEEKRPRTCKSCILNGRLGRDMVCSYTPYLTLCSVAAAHSNAAGLTETSTVVCSSAADDIWFGSSGSLLPSYEAKLVSMEGHEITGYDQPGELVVRGPTVVLGYLNNDQANKETFQDGWMRTGDEAVVRKSPKGTEHIFIVDRIKELIKVKVRAW